MLWMVLKVRLVGEDEGDGVLVEAVGLPEVVAMARDVDTEVGLEDDCETETGPGPVETTRTCGTSCPRVESTKAEATVMARHRQKTRASADCGRMFFPLWISGSEITEETQLNTWHPTCKDGSGLVRRE